MNSAQEYYKLKKSMKQNPPGGGFLIVCQRSLGKNGSRQAKSLFSLILNQEAAIRGVFVLQGIRD